MTDDAAAERDGTAARRSARRHHATYLAMALVALALSFALSESAGEVHVPGLGRDLPPLCPLKAWAKLDCPGCGLTRSFVALAHGDAARSFEHHRLGFVLFGMCVYQVFYRVFMIARGGDVHPRLAPIHRWIGRAVIAALVANWILRVLA